MNPPQCTRNDLINSLIAAFQTCSCTEASCCLPSDSEPIAHDSVKHLLERQSHHPEALYNEAKPMIRQNEGVLVIDDIDRTSFKDVGWNIEEYHRGIEQCCGSEKYQGRKEVVQRGHFLLALLAFPRLESYRLKSGGKEVRIKTCNSSLSYYSFHYSTIILT